MTPHVVIAGGGVGALEGLLALQHHAGDRLRISVVTATRFLTYRALSVAEPFGADPAPRFDWDHIARDRGVRWVYDVVTGVRPEARELDTRDGPPVPYDALLLALGAKPQAALPGAIPFAGPRDVLAVGEAIDALRPGRPHSIVFVAAAGTAWTLPLYELALMTAARGRERGLDLAIELVTHESAPLGIFGAEASAAVARRLEHAGVRLRTGTFATEFAGVDDADLVIALPPLTGPRLAGLPDAADGFVPVDGFGRVRGADRVWAVGDMTARPLKQGGLAAQQADVAAADIAAQVAGARVAVRAYDPKLRGLLLTGGEPVYLERRPGAPPASQASGEFLWWPPHKVVGRHLGPYLASIAAQAGAAADAARTESAGRLPNGQSELTAGRSAGSEP
jgi:sulfide:quinone oxidoreductase